VYAAFDLKILLYGRYLAAMEGAEPSLPLLVVGANLLDVMLATADQKVDSFKQHLLENFIKVLIPFRLQNIVYLASVCRIHAILVRIRIHGSVPLTNGFGSGSSSFRQ
jgi:hypothetical protein